MVFKLAKKAEKARELPEPPFPNEDFKGFASPAQEAPMREERRPGRVQEPEERDDLEGQALSEEPLSPFEEEPAEENKGKIKEDIDFIAKNSPPLFIKINKYREVVRNIHDLKTHSLQMRDTMDALADIERELRKAIDMSNKALDRLNVTLSLLDSKLLRLRDTEEDADIPKQVESYIGDLNTRIERIKKDLSVIEK